MVAARAKKGNIGVYYSGLGAVTPVYTVTLKSRVDGELMRVLFKEGQLVKKGDLLIEIDPRPYQVQLDQAQGQLLHDQALLKNAHVDLDRYKVLLNQQAIPEQQYATQEALVTQYEGTLKTDQAAIDSAKLNLTYAHITSPIDGRIGLRLVDPGNIVHAERFERTCWSSRNSIRSASSLRLPRTSFRRCSKRCTRERSCTWRRGIAN